MTIQEVAADAANPAKIPKDMEPGLIATAVYKAPVNNYPNGCHVCEVEIDMETGLAEIRDLVASPRPADAVAESRSLP